MLDVVQADFTVQPIRALTQQARLMPLHLARNTGLLGCSTLGITGSGMRHPPKRKFFCHVHGSLVQRKGFCNLHRLILRCGTPLAV